MSRILEPGHCRAAGIAGPGAPRPSGIASGEITPPMPSELLGPPSGLAPPRADRRPAPPLLQMLRAAEQVHVQAELVATPVQPAEVPVHVRARCLGRLHTCHTQRSASRRREKACDRSTRSEERLPRLRRVGRDSPGVHPLRPGDRAVARRDPRGPRLPGPGQRSVHPRRRADRPTRPGSVCSDRRPRACPGGPRTSRPKGSAALTTRLREGERLPHHRELTRLIQLARTNRTKPRVRALAGPR